MTRNLARVWIAVTLCLAAFAPPAAASGVTAGIAWLAAHQDASGLWGSVQGTPFRDATVAVVALSAAGADSSGVSVALAAINETPATSTDYLARRMLANTFGDAAVLSARQNSDGGWGYGSRYASNLLETALAVLALKSAAHADTVTLGAGVRHLTERQNADHGWAFTAGDTSRVFYTAHVLLALEAVRDSFNVTAPLQSGIAWLKMQAHTDGGFGAGGASNAYETALTLLALAPTDSLAPEFVRGLNYLWVTQRPDGSWNEDAYSTALAVLAMRSTATVSVEPDRQPLTLSFAVAPNPARAVATVALTMPRREQVRLAVYDVTGRLVRMLVNAKLDAGARTLTWDLRSTDGGRASSGAYYLRLSYGEKTVTRKLILTR